MGGELSADCNMALQLLALEDMGVKAEDLLAYSQVEVSRLPRSLPPVRYHVHVASLSTEHSVYSAGTEMPPFCRMRSRLHTPLPSSL